MVKSSSQQAAAAEIKPKLMKTIHAANLVDKNSRTIAKILQLLDVTQRPMATSIDPEGHTSKRVEKLKNRLNRRLQKLARWGDKPVDDRQPAEMRIQLRSSVLTQFKSSYGGMINMPTAGSQAVYNQVAAVSAKIQSYSVTPLPLMNAINATIPTISAAPSSSSSQPPERDSQQKVTNMFNTEGSSTSNPLSVNQPPVQKSVIPTVAAVQTQPENSVLAPLSAPSNLMGFSSLMGTISSPGLSMGGVTTDLESIKALQMQSVKEVSEALRSSDKQS